MSKESAKTAVAAGIAFLDQHNDAPRDWRSRIDPAKVNVYSTDWCPLGQIFDDYYDGTQKLGIDGTNKTYECGFCADDNSSDEELTDAWKVALAGKYSVKDRLNVKGDRGSVLTIVAAWVDDSTKWYVVKYDGGGSHIKSEFALDKDFEKHIPFPFRNGDILTDKDCDQFFVVRDGERRLERLKSAYGSAPQTRNGAYDYYVSEYGELVALMDSTFKKFGQV